jgi:hypothetical protein
LRIGQTREECLEFRLESWIFLPDKRPQHRRELPRQASPGVQRVSESLFGPVELGCWINVWYRFFQQMESGLLSKAGEFLTKIGGWISPLAQIVEDLEPMHPENALDEVLEAGGKLRVGALDTHI